MAIQLKICKIEYTTTIQQQTPVCECSKNFLDTLVTVL
jgi:hypothetical protein